MAFPTGWNSKAALVIQHGQVPADQTAFPVLIDHSSFAANCPEILTTGNAHAAQSNGGDLRFSTDSAGASQIACEIALWSQNATFASARAEIWVSVNILTASDVTIYVWWEGGGGLTQPAANAAFGSQAVWNSNYKLVHHFVSVSLATPDSTATGNAITSVTATAPVTTTGKIGNALAAFSSQYVETGNTSIPTGAGAVTIEAWMNTSSVAAGYYMATSQGDPRSANAAIFTGRHGSNLIGGPQSHFFEISSFFSTSTWYHIVYTYDGTNGRLYTNGSLLAGPTAQSPSVSFTGAAGSQTVVGSDIYDGDWTGPIDEYRIANIALSANWITTDYNNQNSPGTFIISGARIGLNPDVTQLVTDSISLSDVISLAIPNSELFSDSISLSDLAVAAFTGPISTLAEDDILAFADSAVANFGIHTPPSLRGNIDYDQIRASARSGDGSKLLTLKGSFVPGNTVVFDADGNLIDAGHS